MAGVLGFVYRVDLAEVASARGADGITRYRLEDTDGFKEDVNSIVDFLQTEVSNYNIAPNMFYISRKDYLAVPSAQHQNPGSPQ